MGQKVHLIFVQIIPHVFVSKEVFYTLNNKIQELQKVGNLKKIVCEFGPRRRRGGALGTNYFGANNPPRLYEGAQFFSYSHVLQNCQKWGKGEWGGVNFTKILA